MSKSEQLLEKLSINTIRTLSMDAVQKANSGHPGTPMALAPVAYAIWQKRLRFDPDDPQWPNRDRFVLSVGHASMLLYSMLHLTGVKQVGPDGRPTGKLAVRMEDIQNFRQLGSRCPGHPESHATSGVETTTGPLGQGVGNSVGMAIASQWLRSRYNQPGFEIFDFDVYALASDGDLMEGISSEAASIAAHLGLANLCWIYDDNHVTIEGHTDLAFTEDVAMRFRGHGWNVIEVGDANDVGAVGKALDQFRKTSDRPTLILVRSHIAWGAPNKQDSSDAHGSPLGEDEIRATKKFYGWPEDAHFLVPDGVREHFDAVTGKRGRETHAAWNASFEEYRAKHPELAAEIDLMYRRELPDGWHRDIPTFSADSKGDATRNTSGKVLNAVAQNVPWLIGGSADLAPSTKTLLQFDGAGDFQDGQHGGRNLHFGVREHSMTAILNGMATTGVRPYGASFLVFTDYARPSIRLGALMGLPTIQIYTHDSIGLGEDGPTHQPVEHLASLRAIPGLTVIRPADANEVAEAWRTLLPMKEGPVLLALTRQSVPTLDRSKLGSAEGLRRGAYVLADTDGREPEVILMGSGSEVSLCLEARESLENEGIATRVVSFPSWELFEQQPVSYREAVLPPAISARVSVEAGAAQGWERYVGPRGASIAMSSFGESAPAEDLREHFGFTSEKIVEAAKQLLAVAR